MNDADRFHLLGIYHTPRFRYEQGVICEVRGRVTICGLTDGPIPWPVGQRGRNKCLVVDKDLAKAVRREAAIAVARWWGVKRITVWKWKKVLGVEANTEGTARLRQAYSEEPWAVEARAKAHAKARDPARRAKIAAARRGKPRPPHVIEAIARARRGKPLPEPPAA
jgi:hypothetical protein